MLSASTQQQIEGFLAEVSTDRLLAEARRLSESYRQGGTCHLRGSLGVLAYLVTRLPATHAVAEQVLQALQEAHATFTPTDLIDLGAGPGTLTLAARKLFPDARSVAYERDGQMRSYGEQLLPDTRWLAGSLPELPRLSAIEGPRLWMAGHVLNELPVAQRQRLYETLCQTLTPADVLVLVEPGTPHSYGLLMEAREHFLAQHWQIWAPCPHGEPCPLGGDDWCHFSVRLPRTALHRHLKNGVRNFEDEKFAYLILSPTADVDVRPAAGRILRTPRIHKGHVQWQLCTTEGLASAVVSKKQPGYKQLKKLSQGAAVSQEVLQQILPS